MVIRMLKFSVVGWFFVGSLWANTVYAQSVDARLDSIDEVLKQTDYAEEKVALMMEAAELSESKNRPRCVEYTSLLLTHPIVKADSSLYMEALRIQGGANRWIGNYVRSIEELKLCHAYFRHHQDTVNWVFAANHLGSMHVFMGYNEAAQKYMNEVYELEKARGDTAAIAGATNGLAIFYSNINQIELGILLSHFFQNILVENGI